MIQLDYFIYIDRNNNKPICEISNLNFKENKKKDFSNIIKEIISLIPSKSAESSESESLNISSLNLSNRDVEEGRENSDAREGGESLEDRFSKKDSKGGDDKDELEVQIETLKYSMPNDQSNLYHIYILKSNRFIVIIASLFNYYIQVQKILAEFQNYLSKFEEINRYDINDLNYVFCKVFSPYLISPYHIIQFQSKEPISNITKLIKNFIYRIYNDEFIRKNYSEDIIENFLNKIDGISDLRTICDKVNIDLEDGKNISLFLHIMNYVKIRLPIYDWEVYERTHKANKYLFDGSDEQKYLISLYGGMKIISLLSNIDGFYSLKDLKLKLGIPDVKLFQYINTFLDLDLVKLVNEKIEIKEITDDLIPLLTLKGIDASDISLLTSIKDKIEEKKCLKEIALENDISPIRIKKILDSLSSIKNSL